MGFPCCARFPSCTCRRQYPGAATGRRLRSSHPAVSAFPEIAVGSACTSSFSRLARRSLGLRPAHSRRHLYVTRYTEGFSHFVTSMTAPVASGWSVRRVGLSPTGKRRLSRRTQIAVIRPPRGGRQPHAFHPVPVCLLKTWRALRMSARLREFAASSNGDRWYLGRSDETMRAFVVQKANLPSGGAVTHIEIGPFLNCGPIAPEHEALLRLIGTLVDGNANASRP